jgi:hypothetical protein
VYEVRSFSVKLEVVAKELSRLFPLSEISKCGKRRRRQHQILLPSRDLGEALSLEDDDQSVARCENRRQSTS